MSWHYYRSLAAVFRSVLTVSCIVRTRANFPPDVYEWFKIRVLTHLFYDRRAAFFKFYNLAGRKPIDHTFSTRQVETDELNADRSSSYVSDRDMTEPFGWLPNTELSCFLRIPLEITLTL